jgi:hypothetical protein
VELFFITSKTDEAKCPLDLKALKKHEKEALQRLIELEYKSQKPTNNGK